MGTKESGGDTTNKLLKRVNNIPNADYYILLIGTNDWKNDIETTFSNSIKITDHLTSINTKAKYYI